MSSLSVQVLAKDADSEHFGRVSYLITNDETAFTVGEDGWIITSEMLDQEAVRFRRSCFSINWRYPSCLARSVIDRCIRDLYTGQQYSYFQML